jgi:predicted DsbA family dithiol-disulfide isomerase
VEWQPFFLNHNTPAEGEDMYEHLASKYGPEKARIFTAPDNPLTQAGSKVGITFNPDRRIIRTEASHRLVEWVKEVAPDKEDALMNALFVSYFEQAKDLSKSDELLACAGSCGLDISAAATMLDSSRYRSEVITKAMSWSRQGVRGVPFFVIHPASGNGKPVGFSGAQPSELIKEILQEQAEA